jgi:hypothetical protein
MPPILPTLAQRRGDTNIGALHGVRLVLSLFPERKAPAVKGWLATGALPAPPSSRQLVRPG